MTLEGSLSSLEFEEELKLDTSSLERKTKKDRLAPFTAEELRSRRTFLRWGKEWNSWIKLRVLKNSNVFMMPITIFARKIRTFLIALSHSPDKIFHQKMVPLWGSSCGLSTPRNWLNVGAWVNATQD